MAKIIKNNFLSLAYYLLIFILSYILLWLLGTISNANRLRSDSLSSVALEIIVSILIVSFFIIAGALFKPTTSIFTDFLSLILVGLIGLSIWAYCYRISPNGLLHYNTYDNSGVWWLYTIYLGGIELVYDFFRINLLEKVNLSLDPGLHLALSFVPTLLFFCGMELRRFQSKEQNVWANRLHSTFLLLRRQLGMTTKYNLLSLGYHILLVIASGIVMSGESLISAKMDTGSIATLNMWFIFVYIFDLMAVAFPVLFYVLVGFTFKPTKSISNDFFSFTLISVINLLIWCYCYFINPRAIGSSFNPWDQYYHYFNYDPQLIGNFFIRIFRLNNNALPYIWLFYSLAPMLLLFIGIEVRRSITWKGSGVAKNTSSHGKALEWQKILHHPNLLMKPESNLNGGILFIGCGWGVWPLFLLLQS